MYNDIANGTLVHEWIDDDGNIVMLFKSAKRGNRGKRRSRIWISIIRMV